MAELGGASAALALARCAKPAPQMPTRRPNIVVILADDLGYGDLGIQGGNVPTPHIDSVARGGVRFTDGYTACPVCGPARAGLMTGRYQQRFGFWFNGYPPSENGVRLHLPLTETTLAQLLHDAGYATGCVGEETDELIGAETDED